MSIILTNQLKKSKTLSNSLFEIGDFVDLLKYIFRGMLGNSVFPQRIVRHFPKTIQPMMTTIGITDYQLFISGLSLFEKTITMDAEKSTINAVIIIDINITFHE